MTAAPPVRRINLPKTHTLTPQALAALAFLAPTKGAASAAVCDALEALACARGWRPEKEQGASHG